MQTGSFLESRWALLLQAAIGFGATAWMAHGVDAGLTRAWSGGQQVVWFVAMLCTMGVGARGVIALRGGDTRFAWVPLIVTFWLGVAVATGLLLQSFFGLTLLSGILGAFAAMQAWWTGACRGGFGMGCVPR